MTERARHQQYRSFSQVSTYLECGEQYRLKYIERHKEAPSVWSIGGTAFHTVAERFLLGQLDRNEIALTAAWTKAWDEAYQDVISRGLPEGTDPDPETWRAANRGTEGPLWWSWHGPQMVRSFRDWWDTAGLTVYDLDGPALERELLIEIGGVPVRAIPDALVVDEHGQLDVLDYKSGRADKLIGKDPFQLKVYAAAVEVATGLKPTWGLFYGTRLATAYPNDLSQSTVEQIGEVFADFDSKELAGIYKPNPGSQCRFCGVRDHCAYKKER